MGESLHIEGLLRIYEVPEDDALQHAWHRLTLSEKAREGHLVVEAHNLITSAGRTQLLTFTGSNSTTTAWAQYYAVGTGAIYSVQASDIALATELFRAVPASFTVVGNGVTVTTNFTAAQAVGTYTNAGVFGNGATGTAGSGTLMTHLLYSYTKSNTQPIVSDYLFSLT